MSYQASQAEIGLLHDAMHDVPEIAGYRSDYSGRGMYGKTCIGFDVNETRHGFQILMRLAELDKGFAKVLTDHYAQDDMGRGKIIYFPGVTEAEAALLPCGCPGQEVTDIGHQEGCEQA